MSTDENWQYAVAALAALGIGAMTYAAMNANTRRTAFKSALRTSFESHEVEFVDANLARANGLPKWLVTVVHPIVGVVTYRVSLPLDTEPYSQFSLNEILRRVIDAVESPGAAVG